VLGDGITVIINSNNYNTYYDNDNDNKMATAVGSLDIADQQHICHKNCKPNQRQASICAGLCLAGMVKAEVGWKPAFSKPTRLISK